MINVPVQNFLNLQILKIGSFAIIIIIGLLFYTHSTFAL